MKLRVNGREREVEAHPMKRLLDVLREDCGLTGTKEGCGEGECGACTVLLGGRPVNSCLVPLAHAREASVVTIEGVKNRALLEAFVAEGGAQCGFCTPGVLMAAVALPKGLSATAIREGLAGNLCRCTGYTAIERALVDAGRAKAAGRQGARGAKASRGGKPKPTAGRNSKARLRSTSAARGAKAPLPSGRNPVPGPGRSAR
ncbi:MAG: (2Fe-2S)-binding protein [Vicinamibacteria bacterium]